LKTYSPKTGCSPENETDPEKALIALRKQGFFTHWLKEEILI
jgi:hypothetical protein